MAALPSPRTSSPRPLSPRVATPGLNVHGDPHRAAIRLRWWELPTQNRNESRSNLDSPRKNSFANVAPKVDCGWRSPRRRGHDDDGSGLDPNLKAWEDEYARLTAYLQSAYGTDEGLEHSDAEVYDAEHSVGQLLAHYDHGAETKQHANRNARREARRLAKLEGHLSGVNAPDEECSGADVSVAMNEPTIGRVSEDDVSRARRDEVWQLARRMGHPFSTLRASSNVRTWWPVNSHARPAWGASKYVHDPHQRIICGVAVHV